jgi:uncharacterized phage protein (TIGR01671 family)
MREIKFRAWAFDSWAELLPKEEWDKERTPKYKGKWSMCEVYTYHVRKNKVRVHTGRGFDKCMDIEIGELCTLMQYTGLKDKNGKEIYEGDVICVVEDALDGGQEGTFMEVYFDDFGCWQLRGSPILKGEVLYDHHKYAQIIGNIYENPDLLTD